MPATPCDRSLRDTILHDRRSCPCWCQPGQQESNSAKDFGDPQTSTVALRCEGKRVLESQHSKKAQGKGRRKAAPIPVPSARSMEKKTAASSRSPRRRCLPSSHLREEVSCVSRDHVVQSVPLRFVQPKIRPAARGLLATFSARHLKTNNTTGGVGRATGRPVAPYLRTTQSGAEQIRGGYEKISRAAGGGVSCTRINETSETLDDAPSEALGKDFRAALSQAIIVPATRREEFIPSGRKKQLIGNSQCWTALQRKLPRRAGRLLDANPAVQRGHKIVIETIDTKEVDQVHECIRNVFTDVIEERVIEVPEIEIKEVEVVKTVEVPAVREELDIKEKAVNHYVETPVPEIRTIKVENEMPRLVPVPIEQSSPFYAMQQTRLQLKMPKLVAVYEKVPLPVYLPRFVEVPLPVDVTTEEFRKTCECMCEEVAHLVQAAYMKSISLCKLERLGVEAKQWESRVYDALNGAKERQQAALLSLWRDQKLRVVCNEDSLLASLEDAQSFRRSASPPDAEITVHQTAEPIM